MKKSELKYIIREELQNALNENEKKLKTFQVTVNLNHKDYPQDPTAEERLRINARTTVEDFIKRALADYFGSDVEVK